MNADPSVDFERQLHELDAQLNRLRREIFLTQRGLRPTENLEETLAELHRQFRMLGDRFVEVYRQWSRSQAE